MAPRISAIQSSGPATAHDQWAVWGTEQATRTYIPRARAGGRPAPPPPPPRPLPPGLCPGAQGQGREGGVRPPHPRGPGPRGCGGGAGGGGGESQGVGGKGGPRSRSVPLVRPRRPRLWAFMLMEHPDDMAEYVFVEFVDVMWLLV